ncbi:hypothetical protein SAMN02910358_02377 [Lachnospiraceae bacterium XBB1006]|jgi:hypothetical protein|nr:hypothetical protein SAMN02910358_02377 [Lachnospiraceae bacterium XBB1006]
MINIRRKDFNVLVNFFYSEFFCDYLEEVISDLDDEKSVVTLFKGMEYFIEMMKEYGIEVPFCSIKDYLEQNYEDGNKLFLQLKERYDKEQADYQVDEEFGEMFGSIDFA